MAEQRRWVDSWRHILDRSVTGAAIAGAPDPRQAATTLAFYRSLS
jgi:hypothetical protein